MSPRPSPSADTDLDHADRPPLLAGMALRNGVLIIGPDDWSAAVRAPDGEIERVTRRRWTMRGPLLSVPFIRGPLRIAEMVSVLPRVRTSLPASRLPHESMSLLAALSGSALVAAAARRRFGPGVRSELASGAASLTATMMALRSGEIAAYHGAEHKVIGAFENGIEPIEASRVHPRCGTHLAVPMVLVGSLATAVALRAFPRHPRAARWAGTTAALAVATELGRAMQAEQPGPVSRGFQRVGALLQRRVSTTEPDSEQLDVAQVALDGVVSQFD